MPGNKKRGGEKGGDFVSARDGAHTSWLYGKPRCVEPQAVEKQGEGEDGRRGEEVQKRYGISKYLAQARSPTVSHKHTQESTLSHTHTSATHSTIGE
jgi:hypothetical protein